MFPDTSGLIANRKEKGSTMKHEYEGIEYEIYERYALEALLGDSADDYLVDTIEAEVTEVLPDGTVVWDERYFDEVDPFTPELRELLEKYEK